jgi:hypothetical protein
MASKQYKITSFDEAAGQIVAEVDGFQPMAIDLPLVDGEYLVGDALDTYVMGFFPTHAIDRLAVISKGVKNSAAIASMVESNIADQITPEELANREMWLDIEFERRVSKALLKFGIISSDPTSIGVTSL